VHDPLRRIEPLHVDAPRELVLAAVLRTVAAAPGGRVLERDDASVHAQVCSRILRLPFDVLVTLTPPPGGAASRTGAVHVRVAAALMVSRPTQPRRVALTLLASVEDAVRRLI
jgi:uncharacterized protein (DUF1499 family)